MRLRESRTNDRRWRGDQHAYLGGCRSDRAAIFANCSFQFHGVDCAGRCPETLRELALLNDLIEHAEFHPELGISGDYYHGSRSSHSSKADRDSEAIVILVRRDFERGPMNSATLRALAAFPRELEAFYEAIPATYKNWTPPYWEGIPSETLRRSSRSAMSGISRSRAIICAFGARSKRTIRRSSQSTDTGSPRIATTPMPMRTKYSPRLARRGADDRVDLRPRCRAARAAGDFRRIRWSPCAA